jgi:hypothetical protein
MQQHTIIPFFSSNRNMQFVARQESEKKGFLVKKEPERWRYWAGEKTALVPKYNGRVLANSVLYRNR